MAKLNNLSLIYPSPFTRIRDKVMIDPETSKLLSYDPFINFEDTFSTSSAAPALFQSAFLNVVTETVYDYPNVFLSEKSFKPISTKRPFVIASSVGCLKNIQDLGFNTFSDYWDEGYDTIEDPVRRMRKIVDIVDWVAAQSIMTLRYLLTDMSDILEHNHSHYHNIFEDAELKKLETMCINNRKER